MGRLIMPATLLLLLLGAQGAVAKAATQERGLLLQHP
jgi:hypothetical protein